MKPYNKASSLRGANTLLQGSRIKTGTEKRDHRRQINMR
jgi:hypothetical protein